MNDLHRMRVVVTLFLVLNSVQSAYADSELMRGITAYKKNDYVKAQSFLREAIKKAPEDSVAHYYLGNTLLKLKNPVGAKTEFRAASDSCETEDIKENCRVALQKLESPYSKNTKAIELKPASEPKAVTANPIRLDSIPLSTEEKKAISPYLKQNGELDQLKSTSMIKDLLPADLTKKAQGMTAQDPALPGLLSDFLGQSQFGSGMSQSERKTFIEDELRKRNIPMDSVLQMIKGQSGAGSQSKNASAQDDRARRLKEVQDNLDDQMNSKLGNSGVQLKPEGTSIYVRNYEHH